MSPIEAARQAMGAIDNFQRRHQWPGVPYAVQKKFGDDNANLVVLGLAWYGFTAIIPLLLVVTTILGQIGIGSLGEGIVNTLRHFPVIGDSLTNSGAKDNRLHGSTLGLVVGLVGLAYGAQGVTQTAQLAMATVWNVPQNEQTGFLPRLGRSIAGLITIGGAFLINAVVATYANAVGNYAIKVPVIAGLLVINFGLYYATFFLLTPKVIGPRGLIPGSVVGAVAFTALLTVGTGLMAHQLSNASNTYGTFAGVIGIVAVLLLLAKLSIYGAELNPVLSRRLYPRALPLGGEPTEADLRVLSTLVHGEQRRDDQVIGVGFGENAEQEAVADARRGRHARPDPDDGRRDGNRPGDSGPGGNARDESGPNGAVPGQAASAGAAADGESVAAAPHRHSRWHRQPQ
jgi:uncharacterized BrkB/YihY/UPF0761 family membrane protein